MDNLFLCNTLHFKESQFHRLTEDEMEDAPNQAIEHIHRVTKGLVQFLQGTGEALSKPLTLLSRYLVLWSTTERWDALETLKNPEDEGRNMAQAMNGLNPLMEDFSGGLLERYEKMWKLAASFVEFSRSLGGGGEEGEEEQEESTSSRPVLEAVTTFHDEVPVFVEHSKLLTGDVYALFKKRAETLFRDYIQKAALTIGKNGDVIDMLRGEKFPGRKDVFAALGELEGALKDLSAFMKTAIGRVGIYQNILAKVAKSRALKKVSKELALKGVGGDVEYGRGKRGHGVSADFASMIHGK